MTNQQQEDELQFLELMEKKEKFTCKNQKFDESQKEIMNQNQCENSEKDKNLGFFNQEQLGLIYKYLVENYPFFQEISSFVPNDQFYQIIQKIQFKNYKAYSVIYKQNQCVDNIYFMFSGEAVNLIQKFDQEKELQNGILKKTLKLKNEQEEITYQEFQQLLQNRQILQNIYPKEQFGEVMILSEISVFSNFPSITLEKMLNFEFEYQKYSPQQIIYQENEEAKYLYYIVSGQISFYQSISKEMREKYLTQNNLETTKNIAYDGIKDFIKKNQNFQKSGNQNREKIELTQLIAGQVFGDMEILKNLPKQLDQISTKGPLRTVSAKTKSVVELLKFDRIRFEQHYIKFGNLNNSSTKRPEIQENSNELQKSATQTNKNKEIDFKNNFRKEQMKKYLKLNLLQRNSANLDNMHNDIKFLKEIAQNSGYFEGNFDFYQKFENQQNKSGTQEKDKKNIKNQINEFNKQKEQSISKASINQNQQKNIIKKQDDNKNEIQSVSPSKRLSQYSMQYSQSQKILQKQANIIKSEGLQQKIFQKKLCMLIKRNQDYQNQIQVEESSQSSFTDSDINDNSSDVSQQSGQKKKQNKQQRLRQTQSVINKKNYIKNQRQSVCGLQLSPKKKMFSQQEQSNFGQDKKNVRNSIFSDAIEQNTQEYQKMKNTIKNDKEVFFKNYFFSNSKQNPVQRMNQSLGSGLTQNFSQIFNNSQKTQDNKIIDQSRNKSQNSLSQKNQSESQKRTSEFWKNLQLNLNSQQKQEYGLKKQLEQQEKQNLINKRQSKHKIEISDIKAFQSGGLLMSQQYEKTKLSSLLQKLNSELERKSGKKKTFRKSFAIDIKQKDKLSEYSLALIDKMKENMEGNHQYARDKMNRQKSLQMIRLKKFEKSEQISYKSNISHEKSQFSEEFFLDNECNLAKSRPIKQKNKSFLMNYFRINEDEEDKEQEQNEKSEIKNEQIEQPDICLKSFSPLESCQYTSSLQQENQVQDINNQKFRQIQNFSRKLIKSHSVKENLLNFQSMSPKKITQKKISLNDNSIQSGKNIIQLKQKSFPILNDSQIFLDLTSENQSQIQNKISNGFYKQTNNSQYQINQGNYNINDNGIKKNNQNNHQKINTNQQKQNLQLNLLGKKEDASLELQQKKQSISDFSKNYSYQQQYLLQEKEEEQQNSIKNLQNNQNKIKENQHIGQFQNNHDIKQKKNEMSFSFECLRNSAFINQEDIVNNQNQIENQENQMDINNSQNLKQVENKIINQKKSQFEISVDKQNLNQNLNLEQNNQEIYCSPRFYQEDENQMQQKSLQDQAQSDNSLKIKSVNNQCKSNYQQYQNVEKNKQVQKQKNYSILKDKLKQLVSKNKNDNQNQKNINKYKNNKIPTIQQNKKISVLNLDMSSFNDSRGQVMSLDQIYLQNGLKSRDSSSNQKKGFYDQILNVDQSLISNKCNLKTQNKKKNGVIIINKKNQVVEVSKAKNKNQSLLQNNSIKANNQSCDIGVAQNKKFINLSSQNSEKQQEFFGNNLDLSLETEYNFLSGNNINNNLNEQDYSNKSEKTGKKKQFDQNQRDGFTQRINTEISEGKSYVNSFTNLPVDNMVSSQFFENKIQKKKNQLMMESCQENLEQQEILRNNRKYLQFNQDLDEDALKFIQLVQKNRKDKNQIDFIQKYMNKYFSFFDDVMKYNPNSQNIEKIFGNLKLEFHNSKDVIFQQGDFSDAIYFILAGEKNKSLRTASVVCSKNTVLILLKKEIYEKYIEGFLSQIYDNRIKDLQKIPIFSNWKRDGLEIMLYQQFEEVEYQPKQIIFKEGEKSEYFYLIEEGEVEMFANISGDDINKHIKEFLSEDEGIQHQQQEILNSLEDQLKLKRKKVQQLLVHLVTISKQQVFGELELIEDIKKTNNEHINQYYYSKNAPIRQTRAVAKTRVLVKRTLRERFLDNYLKYEGQQGDINLIMQQKKQVRNMLVNQFFKINKSMQYSNQSLSNIKQYESMLENGFLAKQLETHYDQEPTALSKNRQNLWLEKKLNLYYGSDFLPYNLQTQKDKKYLTLQQKLEEQNQQLQEQERRKIFQGQRNIAAKNILDTNLDYQKYYENLNGQKNKQSIQNSKKKQKFHVPNPDPITVDHPLKVFEPKLTGEMGSLLQKIQFERQKEIESSDNSQKSEKFSEHVLHLIDKMKKQKKEEIQQIKIQNQNGKNKMLVHLERDNKRIDSQGI
ncbi:Cyclic nucleotide-binding protein [Pseudocohnilembus persalinus]|uniref:Cyclic nucleotide-binding protein n=1 Tax=Pseudocohnilembus persalinus TaxID=266149 RepID=A0A0V0QC77_PSEPJ|nr:Cyclic nucleotide-binding protein [Pseudocohnilembus persalinus]|eukprot:KRW99792.1 Cyclic nucleotide-binding protein [Pseudocohnilembus persalinus]